MLPCIRIKEQQRIQYTANLFGIHFPLTLEPAIYNLASHLSPQYNGGYWQFYQLASGGFYMAPDTDSIFNISCENGFEGTMSADALGITTCLYAYSHLSFSKDKSLVELCRRQYHLLRDFALEHGERHSILAAID